MLEETYEKISFLQCEALEQSVQDRDFDTTLIVLDQMEKLAVLHFEKRSIYCL